MNSNQVVGACVLVTGPNPKIKPKPLVCFSLCILVLFSRVIIIDPCCRKVELLKFDSSMMKVLPLQML